MLVRVLVLVLVLVPARDIARKCSYRKLRALCTEKLARPEVRKFAVPQELANAAFLCHNAGP